MTCARCGSGIFKTEDFISLNKVWHKCCFTCHHCDKRLDKCSAKIFQGELFCDCCYTCVIEKLFKALSSPTVNRPCRVASTPSCNVCPTLDKRLEHCQFLLKSLECCTQTNQKEYCFPAEKKVTDCPRRNVQSCICIPTSQKEDYCFMFPIPREVANYYNRAHMKNKNNCKESTSCGTPPCPNCCRPFPPPCRFRDIPFCEECGEPSCCRRGPPFQSKCCNKPPPCSNCCPPICLRGCECCPPCRDTCPPCRDTYPPCRESCPPVKRCSSPCRRPCCAPNRCRKRSPAPTPCRPPRCPTPSFCCPQKSCYTDQCAECQCCIKKPQCPKKPPCCCSRPEKPCSTCQKNPCCCPPKKSSECCPPKNSCCSQKNVPCCPQKNAPCSPQKIPCCCKKSCNSKMEKVQALCTAFCIRCGQKVYSAEKILASSGAFHTSCFSCYCCNKLLDVKNVFEGCGEIYCKQCYNHFFGVEYYGFGRLTC